MTPEELRQILATGLPGSEVTVTGDGRHFDARVVSDAFEGLSVIRQHRLVYEILGDRFDRDVVHALSIKTYTPAQWRALNG